jgi:hypothetical protein
MLRSRPGVPIAAQESARAGAGEPVSGSHAGWNGRYPRYLGHTGPLPGLCLISPNPWPISRLGSPRHVRADRCRAITVAFATATVLATMRWPQGYYLFILAAVVFTAATICYQHRRHRARTCFTFNLFQRTEQGCRACWPGCAGGRSMPGCPVRGLSARHPHVSFAPIIDTSFCMPIRTATRTRVCTGRHRMHWVFWRLLFQTVPRGGIKTCINQPGILRARHLDCAGRCMRVRESSGSQGTPTDITTSGSPGWAHAGW